MEELQARHRKEQRDLQSRVTQKKKSSSKKTRKGVNDECEKLEQELKERQAAEVASFHDNNTSIDGDGTDDSSSSDHESPSRNTSAHPNGTAAATEEVPEALRNLRISAKPPQRPDPQPTEEQQPAASQSKKPNRQKARLARRAAEQEEQAAQAEREASDLPRLREQERERMTAEFARRGLAERTVRADGHCLYSAVADQLAWARIPIRHQEQTENAAGGATAGIGGVEEDFRVVRYSAAEFMANHRDDFEPFLEEPFDEYVKKVKNTGEWGGQMELLALAKTYGVNIHVLQDGRVDEIDGCGTNDDSKSIWLAYYRHGFGLGEHYNSLRKIE